MRVKELIKLLETFEDDAIVMIESRYGGAEAVDVDDKIDIAGQQYAIITDFKE